MYFIRNNNSIWFQQIKQSYSVPGYLKKADFDYPFGPCLIQVGLYFSHRIIRLKICSVVLLPALNPVCSSLISFAWDLSLFKMTFSMTLLE